MAIDIRYIPPCGYSDAPKSKQKRPSMAIQAIPERTVHCRGDLGGPSMTTKMVGGGGGGRRGASMSSRPIIA